MRERENLEIWPDSW